MGASLSLYVAFLSLVAIQVCIGIVYKMAGGADGYSFSPALMLTMTEFLKLCIAGGLLATTSDSEVSVVMTRHLSNARLLLSIFGLAVLYSANNVLAFYLNLAVDPATLAITKSLASAVVAALSYIFLSKEYSRAQWVAIVLQVMGLTIVHLNVTPSSSLPVSGPVSERSFGTGVLLVASVIISGVAGVWNAHLLRQTHVSLQPFNILLYGFGVALNFIIVYCFWEGARLGILDGWSLPMVGILVCNSLIGLAISVIYKYADALTRTWATAIATCVLYAVVIFLGWGSFPVLPLVQGISIVFGAAFLFQASPTIEVKDAASITVSGASFRSAKVLLAVFLLAALLFSARSFDSRASVRFGSVMFQNRTGGNGLVAPITAVAGEARSASFSFGGNFSVDGTVFAVVRNLKSYDINVHTSQYSFNFYPSTPGANVVPGEPASIVLIAETPLHDAFTHWVYECAVFLPFYHLIVEELGKVGVSIPVKYYYISEPHRTYKHLFFKLFGLENAVVTHLPRDALFLVAPVVTLNNQQTTCTLMGPRIARLRDYSYSRKQPVLSKSIEYLLLSRSKKENYVNNDRNPSYSNVLDFLRAQNKTVTSYDTVNTADFNTQIQLLWSAKNVILDYGSSLFVNGVFCESSRVFIVGNLGQHNGYIPLRCIMDAIKRSNSMQFIESDLNILL